MALNALLGHSAHLKLSTSFHGQVLSSSSNTSFLASPICLPLGNQSFFSKKHFVVFSGKMSGLDEARRIKRERELQVVKKDRKGPPLRCGKVSPPLSVPDHIPRPPYVGSNILPEIASEYQIPDSQGIAKMRAACKLAARVLNFAGTLVRPSVTTNEIDKAVHQMIIDAGAYPSPLGYGGFPKSVCTSVNECMCHGIPDSRLLQNGDIINIDVTVYLNGYHGDTSKTFFCGEVSDALKHLVKVSEECLERGIGVCKNGAPFKKIGKIIRNMQVSLISGIIERYNHALMVESSVSHF
ncbi:variant 2 [Lathyrus oleraceus]|uniref:Variant 2 n=1 Tax=Pisum sativum TaxID=3888 RepID=A0A9D5B770_PEA|nr:variant 2 [Pisum sativum]